MSWKDYREIIRATSGIVLTKFVYLPKEERLQLDTDLYIRKVQDPKDVVGTVLIIRGGAFHLNKEGHYVKLACRFLPNHRIYFFEKFRPLVSFKPEEVGKAIRYIRKLHPGLVIVLGFSMGGILTWSYLGKGYHEADLYVPVSAPINLPKFNQEIHKHPVYERLYKRTLDKLQVKDEAGLLAKVGSSLEEHQRAINDFLPNLQKTQSIWQNYCYPVSGTEDTLLEGYPDDLKTFQEDPNAILVEGGTHCCIDVIWYACLVIQIFSNRENIKDNIRKYHPRVLGC